MSGGPDKVTGGGKRDAKKRSSAESTLPPEDQKAYLVGDPARVDVRSKTAGERDATSAGVRHPEEKDADAQFVRRRSGNNPTRNPDGVHSANPVVISGDGDATQPVEKGKKS